MKEQRDLGLTEKDVICVSLAGLAHDMGHGPFSHQFEIFLKKVISQVGMRRSNIIVVGFDMFLREVYCSGMDALIF
jgi:HD superfamily phosphohydrolase